MFPAASDFRSGVYGDAWWRARNPSNGQTYLCESVGRAVIAQLQALLNAAVRPGTPAFTMVLSRRVAIDGILGPETLNALWVYARMRGQSGDRIARIEQDIRGRTFSPPVAALALWLLYFQPRNVNLDVGPAGARTAVDRVDPALLWEAPSDALLLSTNVMLPGYREAGAVPATPEQLLQVPVRVLPLDAAGTPIRDQQQTAPVPVLPVETPTDPAPTERPAPPPGAPGTAGASGASASPKSIGPRPAQLLFGGLIAAGLYLALTD